LCQLRILSRSLFAVWTGLVGENPPSLAPAPAKVVSTVGNCRRQCRPRVARKQTVSVFFFTANGFQGSGNSRPEHRRCHAASPRGPMPRVNTIKKTSAAAGVDPRVRTGTRHGPACKRPPAEHQTATRPHSAHTRDSRLSSSSLPFSVLHTAVTPVYRDLLVAGACPH